MIVSNGGESGVAATIENGQALDRGIEKSHARHSVDVECHRFCESRSVSNDAQYSTKNYGLLACLMNVAHAFGGELP